MAVELVLNEVDSGEFYFFSLFFNPIKIVKKSKCSIEIREIEKLFREPALSGSSLQTLYSVVSLYFIQKGFERFRFRALVFSGNKVLFNSRIEHFSPKVSDSKPKAKNSRELVEFFLKTDSVPVKAVPDKFLGHLWYLNFVSALDINLKLFNHRSGFVPLVFFKPTLGSGLSVMKNPAHAAVCGLRPDIKALMLKLNQRGFKCMLDCGTGSGSLSVPMALFHPDKSFVAVDSDQLGLKRLERAIDFFGLKNVRVVNSRIEDLEPRDFAGVDLVAGARVSKSLAKKALAVFSSIGDNFLFYNIAPLEKNNVLALNSKGIFRIPIKAGGNANNA